MQKAWPALCLIMHRRMHMLNVGTMIQSQKLPARIVCVTGTNTYEGNLQGLTGMQGSPLFQDSGGSQST